MNNHLKNALTGLLAFVVLAALYSTVGEANMSNEFAKNYGRSINPCAPGMIVLSKQDIELAKSDDAIEDRTIYQFPVIPLSIQYNEVVKETDEIMRRITSE